MLLIQILSDTVETDSATLCQLQMLKSETLNWLENHELFGVLPPLWFILGFCVSFGIQERKNDTNKAKMQRAGQFQISNACLSCLQTTELTS